MENDLANEPIDVEDDSRKEEVESLLGAIVEALEDDENCSREFVNEFGDLTIAISLDGNQQVLDNFMEKQELNRCLADVAEGLTAALKEEGKDDLVCCFTGHRSKKVPWLADDDDYRTKRLRDALKALVDGLSLHGVKRYIAGNADGFDTIAAETVLASNEYLEISKAWEGVPEGWKSPELEIAIPFEGHNAADRRISDIQDKATLAHVVSDEKSHAKAFFERNEYMVDHADIVIAFLDDSDGSEKGGTVQTFAYALQQGKAVIVFYTRWFEDGWPNIGGISVVPPHAVELAKGEK